MHKVADEIQANIRIPLLHIADATAQKITSLGLKKIGLLGTRFSMEEDFYKGRLINKYELEVIIPNVPEREIVHRVIIELLVHNEYSQVGLFDQPKYMPWQPLSMRLVK
jgi:aspartate racemase